VPLAASQTPDVQSVRRADDRRRECQKQPHEKAIISRGPNEASARPQ
jgi:hypothetical protein